MEVGSIQRVIENFNWQYAFKSKHVNEKLQVLSEELTNILSNFLFRKLLKFLIFFCSQET